MEIFYHEIRRKPEVDAFLHEWNNAEDFIICHTSGSTGAPKTIHLEKSKMRKSAEKTISFFNLQPGQNAALTLSCDTIAGKMMIVRAMECRMKLHILPLCQHPLEEVTEEIDFISMVPAQAASYLDSGATQHANTIVIIGGAPISLALEEKIAKHWKNAYQSYGMTETYSHVAIRQINGSSNNPYHAIPGVTFSTKEGNLAIHAPQLLNTTLVTTDIVELLDVSTFRFIGRSDFAINSGGIKVHPENLEQRLGALISGDFMITSAEHALFGETTALIITDKAQLPKRKAMLDSELFNHYEIPRVFQEINPISRTENGKIDRIKIQETIDPHAWNALL
jgi:O-succinylbenzoic acid--CoA ligase